MFNIFNKKIMEEENKVSSESVESVTTDPTSEIKVDVLPEVSLATEFKVYGADGVYMRTYSVEVHGENAGELAKQFAAQYEGALIK